jgi:HAD superfamily hydrolase (TIGR01509 family)
MTFLKSQKFLHLVSLILCIAVSSPVHITTYADRALDGKELIFIFDLGGVLVKTDRLKALASLGILSILKQIMWYQQTPALLQKKLYTTLTAMEKFIPNSAEFISLKSLNACDGAGVKMPLIMRAWLAGFLSGTEVVHAYYRFASSTESEYYFANLSERQLISDMVQMVFTPTLFIETQYIPEKVQQTIEQLKQSGFRIYILSNWEEEAFLLLQARYPEFFALFDGIMISGMERCMKPDQEIFTRLLNRYDLQPQNCLFFDDQIENIHAARELSLHAVQCQDVLPIVEFVVKRLTIIA